MVKVAILVAYMVVLLVIIASFVSSNKPLEIASPHNRVNDAQILLYHDKVVINVNGASLTKYADTNSMDPLLDEGAIGIELVPERDDQLYIGDVVAYESKHASGLIVHRIIDIVEDKQGKYFILKGDNLQTEDPEKVRFSEIKYVLIGVIY